MPNYILTHRRSSKPQLILHTFKADNDERAKENLTDYLNSLSYVEAVSVESITVHSIEIGRWSCVQSKFLTEQGPLVAEWNVGEI
jgi:hypothetical protein